MSIVISLQLLLCICFGGGYQTDRFQREEDILLGIQNRETPRHESGVLVVEITSGVLALSDVH